ncbi:hypothetical protein BDA99DRAFT_73073 [Phascolomyces articulosus]|uniref:Uncharacterized protein n=1 Tax=Phascolomyces articulosus TaxID=60185 RepID=A0AAD5JZW8_9FUNG|nr:hypothetical protein BDA99DRAFT_73073 [Phascolomyces articulosus]
MKLHAVFKGTFEIVTQSFNAPLLTLNGLNCFFFFLLIYLIDLLYSLKLFLQYLFFVYHSISSFCLAFFFILYSLSLVFSNLFFYVHSSIWIFSSHFEMNAAILFPKHSGFQCFLFLVDAISFPFGQAYALLFVLAKSM